MKLYVKSQLSDDCKNCGCELTKKLDELAGLNSNDIFSHYILVTKSDIKKNCLAMLV